MIKLENVTLNKTARIEELLAYLICKDYIFGEKDCFIGDSSFSNCPDIYLKDLSLGAEVAIVENYDTLKRIENVFQGNINTLQSEKFKNKKPILDKTRIDFDYMQYISSSEEYFDKFNDIIFDKMENQQNNQYKSCKNVCLIVLSCFSKKDFLTPKVVFENLKDIAGLYDKRYKYVFFVLNDYVLCMNEDLKCKVLSNTNLQKFTQNAPNF